MELLDKFNFALDNLHSVQNEELRQEEIVFSSLSTRKSFSVSEEEFKGLVDALESHLHHICAPIAKKIDLNMANHFSTHVQYKEVYACILKNLKQSVGYILSTFNNKANVEVTLTSDQVAITFKQLALRPREDEKALFFKIQNNRFYNAKIDKRNVGRFKVYEVTLTGSWKLDSDDAEKSYSSMEGARKGQWENTL